MKPSYDAVVLHYFNVCKQPPAAIFHNPRWHGAGKSFRRQFYISC